MAYNPNNPNGQATAANSAPVVLALDVIPSISIAEATTGGATTYRLATAAGQNINQVKSGAGKITGWYIYNSNGSSRKVNLYNVLSAPTVGTTTLLLSIIIPALSAANCSFPAGITFSSGLYISTTTGLADNDATTNVAANDLVINIFYK